MSMLNSFSNSITSSTMKLASSVILSRSTPSSFSMMSRTFLALSAMELAPVGEERGKVSESSTRLSRAATGRHMTMPPSTTRTCPVMYDAWSDARNATIPAMSFGLPSRSSGICPESAARASGVIAAVVLDAEQNIVPCQAGIVHEDVDLPEGTFDRLDERYDGSRITDVGTEPLCRAADLRRDGGGARLIASDDRHACACLCQRSGDRAANAAGTARHERRTPRQVDLH